MYTIQQTEKDTSKQRQAFLCINPLMMQPLKSPKMKDRISMINYLVALFRLESLKVFGKGSLYDMFFLIWQNSVEIWGAWLKFSFSSRKNLIASVSNQICPICNRCDYKTFLKRDTEHTPPIEIFRLSIGRRNVTHVPTPNFGVKRWTLDPAIQLPLQSQLMPGKTFLLSMQRCSKNLSL